MPFCSGVTSSRQEPDTTPSPSLSQPVLGMTLAFTSTASVELGGIPAQVIDIWPCPHVGDYLVMLEYAQPVRYGPEVIRQIAAFMSELEVVGVVEPARGEPTSWCRRFWRVWC